MKTASRSVHRATVFGAVLFSSALGFAQQAPSSTPAAVVPAKGESDPILLNPFEVTTSKDVGYQATETLAGTRIRTDLRDIGSAISVATKEFMRDIGATDNQSLLQYMVSTEVGGSTGNFAGLGNDSLLDDANARLRPNQNTRVRGLDSADNTRDFFATDIPWDGYNVSRVDFQRGANSILFGNGSPGGIINAGLDQASFGRNSATVEAKTGSYGSFRGSLNFNHVLIPKELAVRVATLYDKRYYAQEPAYNRDQRYYGAARYEPAFLKKGSARTTLKVTVENGDIDANRPRTTTPYDSFSPWFLTASKEMRTPDGVLLGVLRPMKSRAGYDPFVTGITDAAIIAANPTRTDIGARAALGAANGNTSEAWLGRGTFPGIAGWQNGGFGAIFPDATSGQMSYYLPQAPNATLYNAISSTGVRDGNINGLRGVDNAAMVRLDQYSILGVGGRLTENDGFLYERQGVYRAQAIQNPSIFDFYHKLMDGPNKKEASDFKSYNIQLDQTFFNDKAGISLSYDKQTYATFQRNFLNADSTIVIDVYRFLPMATLNSTTGLFEPLVNPNFGRPFLAATPGGGRTRRERETRRLTPFVDVNFKDIMKRDNLVTKILGRHVITALYEENNYKDQTQNFSRFATDPNNAALLSGPNLTVGARRLATVTYIGPSLATASTPVGANLSNITGQQRIVSGPAYYFDATYRTGAPAAADAWIQTSGLAPNQTGTGTATTTTQAENPANYGAWAQRNLNVINSEYGNEPELTTTWSERRDETKSKAISNQWSLLDRHLVFTGGLRRDTIETFRPGNPTTAATARNGNRAVSSTSGAVDFTAPYEYAGSPTNSFESETLKSWSLVAHSPGFINRHLPFGLRGSVFYNQSANFRPASRVGVLGEAIAPPTGKTRDYGFWLSALDGRVSVKVNRFFTSVKNASLPDNSVLTTTGDEVDRGIQFAKGIQARAGSNGASSGGQYAFPMVVSGVTLTNPDGSTRYSAYQPAAGAATTWSEADWVAADTAAQAQAKAFLDATLGETTFLNAWNIHPENWAVNAANFGLRHDIPGGAAVTGDTQSSGTEVELFLRPTDNWNISANVAKTSAKRLALAGTLSAWLERRWKLYEGPAGDMRWFGGGNGGGSSVPGAKPGDPIADFGRARFGRNGWRWYQSYRAQEGNDVPELRPWRFNVTTSYRFTGKNFGGERLKGFTVGGSYRWEDENIIGYGVKEVTPALPGGNNPAIGAFDISKPYKGAVEKHLDLFAAYNRKIFTKVDWRLQANVRNVLEKNRLIPITVNPDGSPAGLRIAYGPTWELSSRFEF